MVNPNSSFPNLHKANGGKYQIDKQQQKAKQQEELNNNTRKIKQHAWELGQNGTWVRRSWIATRKTKQQGESNNSNKRIEQHQQK